MQTRSKFKLGEVVLVLSGTTLKNDINDSTMLVEYNTLFVVDGVTQEECGKFIYSLDSEDGYEMDLKVGNVSAVSQSYFYGALETDLIKVGLPRKTVLKAKKKIKRGATVAVKDGAFVGISARKNKKIKECYCKVLSHEPFFIYDCSLEVVQEQMNYIVKDLSGKLKDPFEISEEQIKEEAPSINFIMT